MAEKKTQNAELMAEIAKKREALREVRFGAAGSRSKNVKQAITLRKEIARLLTELNSGKVAR